MTPARKTSRLKSVSSSNNWNVTNVLLFPGSTWAVSSADKFFNPLQPSVSQMDDLHLSNDFALSINLYVMRTDFYIVAGCKWRCRWLWPPLTVGTVFYRCNQPECRNSGERFKADYDRQIQTRLNCVFQCADYWSSQYSMYLYTCLVFFFTKNAFCSDLGLAMRLHLILAKSCFFGGGGIIYFLIYVIAVFFCIIWMCRQR